MSDNETNGGVRLERYAVAAEAGRKADEPVTWYVVDRTGRLRDRCFGTGPRALHEARWFARVYNGLEEEDAGERAA